MPLVSLNKIEKLLGGNLADKRILILGVSYRQDVGDTRYSPTEIFVREAVCRGAEIICQDPLVEYWQEMDIDVVNTIPDFTNYDAVVFTVQHKQYLDIDFAKINIEEGTLIFDSNCVLSKIQREAIAGLSGIRFACIGRGEKV